MMQDCATGDDLPPRLGLLGILSRAYPQSAPGQLLSLKGEGGTLELTGTTQAPGCGLNVRIPGDAKPDVAVTGPTRIRTSKVPGGWNVTGCATGDYTFSTAG